MSLVVQFFGTQCMCIERKRKETITDRKFLLASFFVGSNSRTMPRSVLLQVQPNLPNQFKWTRRFLPLHHKVQNKFLLAPAHPGSPRKGCKMVVSVCRWFLTRHTPLFNGAHIPTCTVGLLLKLNLNLLQLPQTFSAQDPAHPGTTPWRPV